MHGWVFFGVQFICADTKALGLHNDGHDYQLAGDSGRLGSCLSDYHGQAVDQGRTKWKREREMKNPRVSGQRRELQAQPGARGIFYLFLSKAGGGRKIQDQSMF